MVVSNLSILLRERGLSIGEVSEKTGISRNTISYLVNNRTNGIRFETLDSLCSLLNVTPNELLIMSEYNILTDMTPADYGINLSLSAVRGVENTKDTIMIMGRLETSESGKTVILSWNKPLEPETAKNEALRALEIYQTFQPVMLRVIKEKLISDVCDILQENEISFAWKFIQDMKEYLIRASLAESLLSLSD